MCITLRTPVSTAVNPHFDSKEDFCKAACKSTPMAARYPTLSQQDEQEKTGGNVKSI